MATLSCEVQEPVSEVLIVDSPDNDSPVRIKSAVGYEAFEHGAHVEYWSATHSKWFLACTLLRFCFL